MELNLVQVSPVILGQPPVRQPKEIQGFISALPINWTAWENNLSGFNLTVIAMENTVPPAIMIGSTDVTDTSLAANTTVTSESQTV